jgi:large subunit ribosomal protein L21
VIDSELKGEKLEIQKFRRRHDSKRHTGHRQKYTVVKITEISVPNLEVVEAAVAE